MKEQFKKWLIDNGYTENTTNGYVSAINQISKHLSEKIKSEMDIYRIEDYYVVDKLSELYGKTGGYSKFGDNGNGTVRNAIRRYFEFLTNE